MSKTKTPSVLEVQARYAIFAALADGRRVLDFDCQDGRGLGMLAEGGAAEITALASEPHTVVKELAEAGIEGVEVMFAGPLPLAFEDQTFDLVICHDLPERLLADERWVAELRRIIAPEGYLALALANADGPVLSALWGGSVKAPIAYQDLYQKLAPTFGQMSAFGQSPVAGTLFFDFASEEEDPGLTLDRSLLSEDGEQPGWFVLLFGPEAVHRDDLALVQIPFAELAEAGRGAPQQATATAAAAATAAAQADSESSNADLASTLKMLEVVERKAETAEAELEAARAELETARSELALAQQQLVAAREGASGATTVGDARLVAAPTESADGLAPKDVEAAQHELEKARAECARLEHELEAVVARQSELEGKHAERVTQLQIETDTRLRDLEERLSAEHESELVKVHEQADLRFVEQKASLDGAHAERVTQLQIDADAKAEALEDKLTNARAEIKVMGTRLEDLEHGAGGAATAKAHVERADASDQDAAGDGDLAAQVDELLARSRASETRAAAVEQELAQAKTAATALEAQVHMLLEEALHLRDSRASSSAVVARSPALTTPPSPELLGPAAEPSVTPPEPEPEPELLAPAAEPSVTPPGPEPEPELLTPAAEPIAAAPMHPVRTEPLFDLFDETEAPPPAGLDAGAAVAQKESPMFGELDVDDAAGGSVDPKATSAPAAPKTQSPLDDLEDLLAASIPTPPARS